MLFSTSQAIFYTLMIVLAVLLILLAVAFGISLTGRVTFKEAVRNTFSSFIKIFKEETCTPAPQPVYNPANDVVLMGTLRRQLSVYDGRQGSYIGCYAGTFSSYNVPCIRMDFCPKHDTNNGFPTECNALEAVLQSYLWNMGVTVFGTHSSVQKVRQGFYYIDILYAITVTDLQALQDYLASLKRNAIATAISNSAPVIDKTLAEDLAKGTVTKSCRGTSMIIGCNLENRKTAIRADIMKTGHICIVGGTGSGKSMLTLYLLYNLCRLQTPVTLYIGDFKKSGDYTGISTHFAEFDKVVDLVDDFYSIFENTPENNPTIQILLIDEYAGLITWLTQQDKKKAEEIKGKIANILMMGRSKNCFTWCIQQRISAQLFPTGIGAIDNYQICLGLSKLSVDSRRSLFAGEHMQNADFEASFQPTTGEGLCLIDGQPLMAIGVPEIKDKEALKRLLSGCFQ